VLSVISNSTAVHNTISLVDIMNQCSVLSSDMHCVITSEWSTSDQRGGRGWVVKSAPRR